jgi:hypothetical protein
MTLPLSGAIAVLLGLPAAYLSISYLYLAHWHRRVWLGNTVVHENGRLTLLGSLFYFDHFVACVPMVLLFALCTAGGLALSGHAPAHTDRVRSLSVSIALLSAAALLVLLAFGLSLRTVGWRRTIDYALQRIERDGVMSRGGNWNQLQLSNVPIALGLIGLGSAFVSFGMGGGSLAQCSLTRGGIGLIALAACLGVGITAFNWSGWRSFLNPRWMAHSIREIATYPLTGIPIALASVMLVEVYLSGATTLTVAPDVPSLVLLGAGCAIAIAQLLLLKNANVLSLAQRPAFAKNGLSVPYLLCSHVFEHFLDFVLIGPLSGGLYALLRVSSCT